MYFKSTEPRQRGSKEQHANGTGGGLSRRRCLTASEKRGVAVFGVSAVSGKPYLKERGFNTPAHEVAVSAVEFARDVEDVVVQVPNSPAIHLPPSSPLPPSSLSTPLPSFLPLSSSSRPLPLRVRVQRNLKPRQRSRFRFGPSTSEPRRNDGLTTFDQIFQIFTATKHRLLDIDERRLVFEEERERRRLVLEEERERRRLVLEEANNRRLHERNIIMLQLMQTLAELVVRRDSHN